MKPLLVLIISFLVCALVTRFAADAFTFSFCGRVAMAVMLLFTSIGHFRYDTGMGMMIPAFIPQKKALVYITGIIEIAAAIGLLIPRLEVITGWMLIIFFILVLPANIYAALHHVDYEKGGLEGKGTKYLWFRVPLQMFFIFWVYCFAIIQRM